jgi:hypothetical protein
MKRTILGTVMLAFSAVFGTALTAKSATAQTLTVDEARAIAKEAYIYGFPLVDSYRVQYSYFVDHGSPEFKVVEYAQQYLAGLYA